MPKNTRLGSLSCQYSGGNGLLILFCPIPTSRIRCLSLDNFFRRSGKWRRMYFPTVWVFLILSGRSCVCLLGASADTLRIVACGRQPYAGPLSSPYHRCVDAGHFRAVLYRCRYQRCILYYFHPSGPYCWYCGSASRPACILSWDERKP